MYHDSLRQINLTGVKKKMAISFVRQQAKKTNIHTLYDY